MITSDILIIGAGPTGLFAVFEAGLLKMKCHLIDALPQPGGQLTELYPKKPIFDIPGFPSINAGDLVDNLMEQIKQFQPGFTLGETAQTLTKLEDGTFEVITNKGTVHRAKAVAIAGGLGTFEPRKPVIDNIADYEEKGVEYFIKEPEHFRGKKVVIAGGGDSALDWSIFLANIASEVTLIHRRNEFRGALDSVEKQGREVEVGGTATLSDRSGCGIRERGRRSVLALERPVRPARTIFASLPTTAWPFVADSAQSRRIRTRLSHRTILAGEADRASRCASNEQRASQPSCAAASIGRTPASCRSHDPRLARVRARCERSCESACWGSSSA